MKEIIPNGVWPTMITPLYDSGEIDFTNLEKLIEWYIEKGSAGLFAVCGSSEMFFLSIEERVELARFVKAKSRGRLPVIASGHISEKHEDQIEEIKAICDTGIDAFVLVSNRLASLGESDDVWKRNAERILKAVDDIPLGIYECPVPYKRLISPKLLKWCADTGRFLFLKDTSCDVENMREKMKAIEGTKLKIFNANAATLLESLKFGISGYSSVMANFHPHLYKWLLDNWEDKTDMAKKLQNFLGVSSVITSNVYPVCAKYYLKHENINISLNSRMADKDNFSVSNRAELDQLAYLTNEYSIKYRV